jgi:hypothetical protein
MLASIGSKTHLVEYWHSVIPFFCESSQVYFSRKISNHVDSSSEFNWSIIYSWLWNLRCPNWDPSSISLAMEISVRLMRFIVDLISNFSWKCTFNYCSFSSFQYTICDVVAENIPFNEKYFQAMLISKELIQIKKKLTTLILFRLSMLF